MDELLYQMIFKRKSFHLFNEIDEITLTEIKEIEKKFSNFNPLIKSIKVGMKIVKADETTCKRGEEYCILLYSEKKENYLLNIGYIGEQLDLYLASKDIGSLWFGIGKVDKEKYNNLDFVIMIAIAKKKNNDFRKDMFKSKRKSIEEIWDGDYYKDIANIVRFTPSACNTQPWKVEATAKELKVYRYKKPGKRGIMPIDKVIYYNRIDIGIFLQFLELCLKHSNIKYQGGLYSDIEDKENVLVAKYSLN